MADSVAYSLIIVRTMEKHSESYIKETMNSGLFESMAMIGLRRHATRQHWGSIWTNLSVNWGLSKWWDVIFHLWSPAPEESGKTDEMNKVMCPHEKRILRSYLFLLTRDVFVFNHQRKTAWKSGAIEEEELGGWRINIKMANSTRRRRFLYNSDNRAPLRGVLLNYVCIFIEERKFFNVNELFHIHSAHIRKY